MGQAQVVHMPGMADDLMREIAPLLAEDGMDLDGPVDPPTPMTLHRALDRAIERRNVAHFTPVGEARSVALTTLRLCVEGISSNQTELAGAILATAQPEPADDSVASVAGTIGIALDLLDTILNGRHPAPPAGREKVRLPKCQRLANAPLATCSTWLARALLRRAPGPDRQAGQSGQPRLASPGGPRARRP